MLLAIKCHAATITQPPGEVQIEEDIDAVICHQQIIKLSVVQAQRCILRCLQAQHAELVGSAVWERACAARPW